jgi:type VI secretion system protein ImpK
MMQAIASPPASNTAAPPGRPARATNGLITLAAPLLELVLKLQTGIIPASNDVRPVVDDLLRQLESGAATLGCSYKHAQDVKFALVAFVDETILNPANQFPLRDEWERNPLQLEHFSEHLAGVKFFEKLDPMLRNIETDVDVVEVYYLCLLLGYKGKYNLPVLEEQLRQIIENVAEHLRRMGRLKPNALSTHWLQTDQPEAPLPPSLPLWIKIAVPFVLVALLLAYIGMHLLLRYYSDQITR